MAQLAIRGHATRGEEVMEMLKMLGGRNPHNYSAVCGSLCFYIGKENNIIYYDWVDCCEDEDLLVFTLEEFLEKFPYKVGDKVYNIIHDENKTITALAWDFEENEVVYQTSNNEYVYVNYLQPHKEESMEEKGTLAEIDLTREGSKAEEIEVILGDYEFVLKEGKTYFVKKKPQYPKTYKECCDIVNANSCIKLVHDLSNGQRYSYDVDNLQRYENMRKLLICRDSYWKIAGDWKPNWNDNSTFKYVITRKSCDIIMYSYSTLNCILAFPTAEIRDVFYGNFKELIEECKELL